MKIVINDSHGGFGLSDDYFKVFLERKGIEYTTTPLSWGGYEDHKLLFYRKDDQSCMQSWEIERNDPVLIELFEELGDKICSWAASFKIVEIPDDVEWEIEDYDGLEWVAEKHRTWR